MGRPRKGGGNEERRIKLDETLIAVWFTEGKTGAEMASMVGCSIPPIQAVLKKLGLSRAAKPRAGVLSGNRNPAWAGGRRLRRDGYIEVWTPTGVRLEHQVVMENVTGRPLADDEIVHHKDENRSNNDPSNLEVMTQSQHATLHAPAMVKARNGHRGASNPRAKLSVANVTEIKNSPDSSRRLGARFGVHPSTIQRIKNGKGWNYEN